MAKYELGSELNDEIGYRIGLIVEGLKDKNYTLSDEELEKTAKAFLLDVIYKYYKVEEMDWDSLTDIAIEWGDDLLP